MTLTPEQIDAYHEQGYIAVEGVFDAGEVDAAFRSIKRIIDEELVNLDIEPAFKDGRLPWPGDKELAVRKLMWFTKVDEHLKAMSEKPKLHAMLEQLVGEPVQMLQEMALLKPPNVGVEKPWHQDMAYFRIEPVEKVIGVWIALDAATTENGCMHVIPGTHRQGPQPHYHIRDCQIPDERVDRDHLVPVPLQPGGAMFFSGLLHHWTPPNASASRRRAIQYHYAGVSCTSITPEAHGKLFSEDGKYAGCAVWPREEAEVGAEQDRRG